MSYTLELPPRLNELPNEYADRLGIYYSKTVASIHKKENGQFFTPLPISQLMASFSNCKKNEIKILDPGCGTAILSCSVIQILIEKNPLLSKVELTTYETDVELSPYTFAALEYLKHWCAKKGVAMHFHNFTNDFILDNAVVLKDSSKAEKYDIVISNPPYFKLSKSDPRTIAANQLVSGQPNIYSFFMGVSSQLLSDGGELIFITPRSFTSGNYFKAFRKYFFNAVQLDRIHLFDSRKDTFARDKVLQETLIIKAVKIVNNINTDVLISSSSGLLDILQPEEKYYKMSALLDFESKENILHLPINSKEEGILRLASNWDKKLSDFYINISTGPVVSFRALPYIKSDFINQSTTMVPLFWLHNVGKMFLEWPKSFKDKGQYIEATDQSKKLLIPNKNYIFLRRFSTKDDNSRLIASPYFCNYYASKYIGVENKVNYLYRKGGHLNREEIVGLCALLNSKLFDTYFQIFNGNVNVSATELREMNFPPIEIINNIGQRIITDNDFSMQNVNKIIDSIFTIENTIE